MSPLKSAALAAALALMPMISDAAFMADEDVTPLEITPDTPEGALLTDKEGFFLYVFNGDEPGKPTCNGACAQLWVPALAGSYDGRLSHKIKIITREDGKKQWTYDDRPLYRYAKDAKAGDLAGAKTGDRAWKPAVIPGHDM